jgi:hypothetical protein
MNDMTIISAWLMPKGINVEPQLVLVDASSHHSIAASLFQYLDWYDDMGDELISISEIEDKDGSKCVLGAVHQRHEGDYLEGGPHDINMLASTFLQVDEPIIGNCLIMCVFDNQQVSDPTLFDEFVDNFFRDHATDDGWQFDDYTQFVFFDLPEWVAEYSDGIVAGAAESWNSMVDKVARVAVALERGLIDEDTLVDFILNENVDMLEMVASAASMTDDDMDAGLRDLLGGD